MLETLEEPDEIWLNDETQHNYMNTFYLIKYYKDEVFAVNFRIENDTLSLKT